ncbi:pentatricopeptide repeat-containing protein At2g03880, mitochondrial-like [Coffea arabica]|uniref:Pentatricopeptide repeat-containing protein At2g03880, mitochondrial-like n=1 Tax=Coffea arabica TaxID=13443 RepID=A0ABM4U3L3_COFAR
MHKLYSRHNSLLTKPSSYPDWCFDLSLKPCSIASLASTKSSLLGINRSLNELVGSGRIDEARKLFEKIPHRDDFTWNTMVSGYADSGRLTEAKKVFDDAPNKSSITWSSLISGYCKYGYETEGFQLFREMQFEGHKPSQYTLGSVLRVCSVKGLLLKGKQVHGYATKTNFDTNVFVITGLIDMYAKCLCVTEAELLFEEMPSGRNHVTWTAMINGYSLNGDAHKTIHCFRGMKVEGVEANQYTFPGVLTACAAVSDVRFGVQVHCCIVREGFEANVFVQSALIDMYAKCGDLHSARKALESMEADHAVSWNSLILGYVKNGYEEEALSLFKVMHERDIGVDDFTYPSVLNCLTSKKDVKIGQSVHCRVIKTGFQGYNLIGNALVDMYAKQGDLSYAFNVFNTILDRDVISWTSAVTGCAHNGSHEEALKLFCKMRNSGVEPDQVITSSILSSCAELALLEFGQQVHANFMKSGLQSSLSVDNSLVTMYANCGCLEEANRVFKAMANRNVITWTALIVGYAQNGKGKESLGLYDQMILSGIKPDFITFIGLLFACSHAGLVDEGCRYFGSMINVHGIRPGPDQYACMVDLLGRAGKLLEAEKLLDEMAVEPDATVWKVFLAACRKHGNIDLAKKAASVLFKLTPQDAVPYVMLSNMYSKAGKWEDAAAVRKLMKSKCISKEPGYSWLEMNGKVHRFMSADRSHPKSDQIYSKTSEVMGLIKKAGYVPDVNFALHDINDEGKEQGLAYHSEKLAVAFGLLYVPQGAPIRIYKNLRVCGDCHTAMKFISKMFCRHIILRDSNCFHHFRDGTCSCRDYY